VLEKSTKRPSDGFDGHRGDDNRSEDTLQGLLLRTMRQRSHYTIEISAC
jgi:hypothetical protein